MPVFFRNRLREISDELRPQVGDAMGDAAQAVAARAAALAPVQTGALKRAIHAERDGPLDHRVVAGNADVWYGHLVEFGSAAHSVAPRRREALRFESGGREVFVKDRVRVPAIPPHPFLIPALEAERAKIEQRVSAAIKQAAADG